MVSGPNPHTDLDSAAADARSCARAPEDWPGVEAGSPSLTLEAFTGPLDHLLTLTRAKKIDIAKISLGALVAQLTAALHQAPASVSLGQKGDWVVMAAWLVQLRARLLLPADAPAQREAVAEADQLRARLVALEAVQALAAWLERRPRLGRDGFARGHPPSRAQSPELFGVSVEAGPAIDVIEFLWASLALFDDPAPPDAVARYQPRRFSPYPLAAARARIRQRLVALPDGAPLDRFLQDPPAVPETAARETFRRRLAWSSTLIAGLELARQGAVVLRQGEDFTPIHVALA